MRAPGRALAPASSSSRQDAAREGFCRRPGGRSARGRGGRILSAGRLQEERRQQPYADREGKRPDEAREREPDEQCPGEGRNREPPHDTTPCCSAGRVATRRCITDAMLSGNGSGRSNQPISGSRVMKWKK